MGKSKNMKHSIFRFLGVFTLLLAFCMPVYAGAEEPEGEYEIYPTPQSVQYESGTTALTENVDVTCADAIDSYTKERIAKTLDVKNLKQSTAPDASNTKLIVGVYGSGDEADAYSSQIGVDDAFFNGEYHYDAYALWISDGTIVVLGEDVDAAYYGVTTLKRIFEQIDGMDVRNLTVKDYGQVEFRGFIEGYYGNPWSNEDRIDLMQFGSEIKMNQYIYAPKDDPLHNRRWRDLYEEEDPESADSITKIADLAKAGNESKCFFVYALHPFMNNAVNLSDSTYEQEVQAVKAKFEQVIKKAGVRQIAILEDDATGESAAHMIRFLNDMQAWLEDLKAEVPDLKTDILYCPTCYMATTDAKMTAISEGVSDKIHIVVTGGKIWGEVSSEFSTAFFNGLNGNGKGRYPYMWVNWPCNDNTKDSQIMGGQNYILHTGIAPGSYEGIVLNPIQESESSKVGIFTASDYCWKIWQEAAEGDQAWEDAFKYIDHMTAIDTEASQALREVAKHQISQKYPNQVVGKQTYFEESVELKPLLEDFRTKLTGETLAESDMNSLKAEFQKISEAADFYLEHGTNRRMAAQMTPFFSSLRDKTRAAMYLMDALSADLAGDSDGVWGAFSEAQAVYDQSGTYGFSYYGAGTLYAKAGVRYITPFVEDIMEYMSPKVLEIVNPEHKESTSEKYAGTISHSSRYTVYQGTLGNLTDGKDSTFVWFGQASQAGDYVQMDLGEEKVVGEVQVLVGAGDGDKWTGYHMEYSTDGEEWTSTARYTGDNEGTDDYRVNLNGILARYIKIVNDAAGSNWVKFTEFSVYPPTEGMVYTNTEDDEWAETHGTDTFSLSGRNGAVLAPGEYVGLKLDRIHEIDAVTVEGTGIDRLTAEQSMNAGEWKTAGKGNARYIRLHNKTDAAVTFDLAKFEVKTKELAPMDLYEKTVAGNADTDSRYWMDGDLTTAAKYQSSPKAGDYITYDLGQDIVLRSLRVYVLDTAIDYPRDAVVQVSADNENWTDVITIGDGVENSADDASTKPVESPGGGWTHDTVDVAYAYAENAEIADITARYIRLYFTAGYSSRWVELNEILINGGEYIATVNDPTFETTASLQRNYEPQMVNDNDLTTSFQPVKKENASLVYYFSDDKTINRINVLQSGNNISNAKVSVKTGEDEWEMVGRLSRSYSGFYTGHLENVYALKLEWENVAPTIYEIITLEDEGKDIVDFMDDNIENVRKDLEELTEKVTQAEAKLKEIETKVADAVSKLNALTNELDKLRAEIDLQKLYAERSEAETAVAETKSVQFIQEAAIIRSEVAKLQAQAKAASSEDEKNNLLQQAGLKEQEAKDKKSEAGAQKNLAIEKESEKNRFEQEAVKKQAELEKALNDEKNKDDNIKAPDTDIKSFTVKGMNYGVLSANKKTVAVEGPKNKKSVKTITIPANVSYQGTTYNVVEIKAGAFKGCSKLTKVIIGKNVTKIGGQAFANCKKLKTVNMKKAAKITSIGKKAFSKIDAKAKFTVPAKKLSKYKKMIKNAGTPKKASVKK